MVKRVKISGYKSLDDFEVHLDQFSLIFGPNAAGKSNFLDALQLVSRIVTHRTLKEAFSSPYRGGYIESFTLGAGGIKDQLQKKSIRFSIEVDIELSDRIIRSVNEQIVKMKGTERIENKDTIARTDTQPKKQALVREKLLRYRIEIEFRPGTTFLLVSDEFVAAIKDNGEIKKGRMPFIETVDNRIHLRMEGQAHPIYYDRYLDYSLLSRSLFPPHYPHIVALQQELSNWFFYYFEPRERMRMPNPVKEVQHIGFMGEELASFLNTLDKNNPKKFKSMVKALSMIIPSITDIEIDINEIGEVEFKVKENGISVPSRVISEGTLRVLGLLALWGVKDDPSVVGFEEPENGLHPGRIKLIAELLKNHAIRSETQLIVTTHSPILPDMVPDDHLFVCKKIDGKTAIVPFSQWGPVWGLLSKQKAIDKALESEEEGLSIEQRTLRGDFDD